MKTTQNHERSQLSAKSTGSDLHLRTVWLAEGQDRELSSGQFIVLMQAYNVGL
jgi:hypothetical protein